VAGLTSLQLSSLWPEISSRGLCKLQRFRCHLNTMVLWPEYTVSHVLACTIAQKEVVLSVFPRAQPLPMRRR